MEFKTLEPFLPARRPGILEPYFRTNPHASLRHRRSMKMLNFYFEYLSFLTKEEGRFLYGG
jgi:hypothetical protein